MSALGKSASVALALSIFAGGGAEAAIYHHRHVGSAAYVHIRSAHHVRHVFNRRAYRYTRFRYRYGLAASPFNTHPDSSLHEGGG